LLWEMYGNLPHQCRQDKRKEGYYESG